MTKEQKKLKKRIIKETNKYFQTDCQLKSRRQDVARPRMYAIKLMRDVAKYTYEEIADVFNMTHANCIYCYNRVNDDIRIMPKYKRYYLELRSHVEKSEQYRKSTFNRNLVKDDFRMDIYRLLMNKNLTELQEIFKLAK